ncbi:hypothetical protein B0H63DRAFT_518196 [Podospora didyma]|uniref:Nephrocystin 3-like N-terminal domain-containing protein n=1 Tax=Podospora didyma TaxID=330526 RepID=A0AAE0P889_9PEZI|nr:hypothetical protein B0H63DRAFT_518196 [Podospora didyma]
MFVKPSTCELETVLRGFPVVGAEELEKLDSAIQDGKDVYMNKAKKSPFRDFARTGAYEWAHILLGIFDIDPEISRRNVEPILQPSHSMRPEALSHVRSIMTERRFKNWMMCPGSSVLLIEGHCEHLGIGKTSPMSAFCASLGASLSLSPSFIIFIIFSYFCGQNTNTHRNIYSGPRGLIRSLITQLLQHLPAEPNLNFLDDNILAGIQHTGHEFPLYVTFSNS